MQEMGHLNIKVSTECCNAAMKARVDRLSRRSPVGTPKHHGATEGFPVSVFMWILFLLAQACGEAAHWPTSFHLLASIQWSATRRSVISLNSVIDSCARGSEWQWSVLWRSFKLFLIHSGNQRIACSECSAEIGCKKQPPRFKTKKSAKCGKSAIASNFVAGAAAHSIHSSG